MYDSVMWKYMQEEEAVLSALLEDQEIHDRIKEIGPVEALYITAHGSSFHAAKAAAPLISRLAGIRVYTCIPADFETNLETVLSEDQAETLIMGISQTGTSSGVIHALNRIKEQGYRILGVTNEPGSPIDQRSTYSFFLKCGEENSNAKTKGYSATLVVLMKFALELARQRNRISAAETGTYFEELNREIHRLDETRKKVVAWCENCRYGFGMEQVFVIGSGIHYATAMEGMLKLMETQCIPAMFNDLREFSHGMHRAVTERAHVILIDTGEEAELSDRTVAYLKQKNVPVLRITTREITDETAITVPDSAWTGSILLITAVLQAVSAFVPEVNGLDPNRDAGNDYTVLAETRG